MSDIATSSLSISDFGNAYLQGRQGGMSATADTAGMALSVLVLRSATNSMNQQFDSFQRALDTRA